MELKKFDNEINKRYATLLINIKNDSNSFYDSYLDLLETTIKYILTINDILFDDSKTIGTIIKDKEVKDFLFNQLKLDDYTYEKLIDYIKKCNDHKHKKEKKLGIESIINYLKIYYSLINYYYASINEEAIFFDEAYYMSIYQENIKINIELKNKLFSLNNEIIDLYQNKKITEELYSNTVKELSILELDNFELDQQNQLLNNQIVILTSVIENTNLMEKLNNMENKILDKLENHKNIIIEKSNSKIENSKVDLFTFMKGADKEYVWSCSFFKFKAYKILVITSSIMLLILGIIITITDLITFGYYSIMCFIENIQMLITFIFLILAFKLSYKISDRKLKNITTYKYSINSVNCYERDKERFIFKFIKVVCIGTSIFSAIYKDVLDFNIVSLCSEYLFFAALVISEVFKHELYSNYDFCILSYNRDYKNSVVHINIINQNLSYIDFINIYNIDEKKLN